MAVFRWVIDGDLHVSHKWRYLGGSHMEMLVRVIDGDLGMDHKWR